MQLYMHSSYQISCVKNATGVCGIHHERQQLLSRLSKSQLETRINYSMRRRSSLPPCVCVRVCFPVGLTGAMTQAGGSRLAQINRFSHQGRFTASFPWSASEVPRCWKHQHPRVNAGAASSSHHRAQPILNLQDAKCCKDLNCKICRKLSHWTPQCCQVWLNNFVPLR